jgi:hypothetical protein
MASGLCVPHKQAAHMAAPTEGQNIKNTLANGEPSTHGAKRILGSPRRNGRFWRKADLGRTRVEWPFLTQSGRSDQ